MPATGNGYDDGGTPGGVAGAGTSHVSSERGSTPTDQPPPSSPGPPPEPRPASPTIPEPPPLPPNSDVSGEVLSSAHAQARQRAEKGDLTGARTLLEEALAAAELQHGRDHPQLAPLMVDLATIARNVGNLTEAQNQLRRAYGIVVTSVGPEHATSLSIEGRLAAVNYRLGEPTEAYDWHIADIGARVLGAEHPAVRGAQQRLAATPVHEEQTPPVEAPALWPSPYPEPGPPYADYAGAESYAPAHDEQGGWAPSPYSAAGSGYAQPGYTQPGHAQPGYSQPGYFEPGYAQAGYAEPGYSEPGYAQAGYAEAGYAPSATDPGVFIRQSLTPAPHEYGSAEAWPGAPVEPIDRPRTRGHGGGVALVASFGLAIIAAAGVIAYQLFGPAPSPAAGRPTPAPSTSSVTSTPSPSAAAPAPGPSDPTSSSPYGGPGLPPGRVTLKDQGTSVTLTWLDPSGGQIPFIVEGGRSDAPASPIVTVAAGRTTQTIYGLNPRFDYCFTVAAVWSTGQVQPSPQTCTRRELSTTST